METMKCNNISDVHTPVTLKDTKEVIEAYCKKCKAHAYFRKDKDGRPDSAYAKFFRRDTLQNSQNLYYKAFPKRMSVGI